MVKALPKKREKGQPKIDGFLVKKKKRAEDNASKTPKAPRAPRAPIPKNAKIIDADGGDDVIFIDRKAGSQIDLTGESPEKEKPDPDFDMAKSEGDKAVEPKVDLDATDDDMPVDDDTKAVDLTLESPQMPKLAYDLSVSSKDGDVIEPEIESKPKSKPKFMDVVSMPSQPQKKVVEVDVVDLGPIRKSIDVLAAGNYEFSEIEVLVNPTGDELLAKIYEVARAAQVKWDLDEYPVIKGGITMASKKIILRAFDLKYYPPEAYRTHVVVCRAIDCNEKAKELEDKIFEYKNSKGQDWFANWNKSNGLLGPNKAWDKEFDEENTGIMYLALSRFDDINKHDMVYRSVKVRDAKPGQSFTPKGRLIRFDKGSTKVKYSEVLEDIFYGSKIDPKEAHDAMKRQGALALNLLCLQDPELMQRRGSLTGGTNKIIDDHYWLEFLEVYKMMFPDHAATAGRVHGHAPLPSVVKSFDELIREKNPKLSAKDVKQLRERNYAVVIQQKNPKRPCYDAYDRYEKYKKAKTVEELFTLKADRHDIQIDIQAGYIKLVVPEPP